ncbi:MAG: uroporphyrinogen-III C-methyltransferase [Cyanobacteria bacterium RI_101]|nr:uroporphyrinogen-III C-methyltransferase [Cyanobacteria bacterium RI_101]
MAVYPAGVYLVGAGLGTRRHLTEGAKTLLQSAEAVVYDALLSPTLLALTPPDCELIPVGKRGGQASCSQGEINRLLVRLGQSRRRIVRLKGGDPLIFGRAWPEMAALAAAGIPFTLEPGLSSALAAPALAGIPLTDREWGQTATILTGHDPAGLDWATLSHLDTLVILMGGRNLEAIVQALQTQVKSPETPCALIRDGGRPGQKVWLGTLATITEKTKGERRSPCVIVIGPVVHRRSSLTMPALPLTGKTILITRSADQSPQFRQLLEERGAEALEVPALVIVPPSSWTELDRAIAALKTFDWLILTSANAADFFWRRLNHCGLDSRALAGLKIAVVGQKTAAALAHYGLQPDLIPPQFVADSLVASFPQPLAGQRMLFPRVESGGREILVQSLQSQGVTVAEVPAYQSACPESLPGWVIPALTAGDIDVITFASSKTVTNFHRLLTNNLGDHSLGALLAGVKLASIGPQTSEQCRRCFGRVDIEAQEYTLEGLAAAIERECATSPPAPVVDC